VRYRVVLLSLRLLAAVVILVPLLLLFLVYSALLEKVSFIALIFSHPEIPEPRQCVAVAPPRLRRVRKSSQLYLQSEVTLFNNCRERIVLKMLKISTQYGTTLLTMYLNVSLGFLEGYKVKIEVPWKPEDLFAVIEVRYVYKNATKTARYNIGTV